MRILFIWVFGMAGMALFWLSLAGFWKYEFPDEKAVILSVARSAMRAGGIGDLPNMPPEPTLWLPILFLFGAALCWAGSFYLYASAPLPTSVTSLSAKRHNRKVRRR